MINFKQTYNRSEFLNFLDKFLPEDSLFEDVTIGFESNYTRKVTRLGVCESLGLDIFEVQHTSTHDARVALSKEVFQLLYKRTTKNKALVLFVPIDSPETYRFSLVSIDVEVDEYKVRKSFSNPRRYSYLLGEGAKVYTPTKYLSVKGRVKDAKDLLDRFSVEVLTKEFYNELFTWYQWALSDEIGVTFPNDRSTESDDRKIEEHLIRLITRLMFVWFIKQKKLVPDVLFEVDQLKSLLKNFEATDGKQDTYYRAILQNLFFATLNNKIEERDFAVDGGFYENKVQYGIKTLFRYADEFSVPKEQVIQVFSKVPFLNGGLFECLDKDTPDSNGKIMYSDGFSRKKGRQSRAYIPNILFFDGSKGIISILNKYNFTIEENSPLDVEVALDPELLGKVFENLLGTYNPETKETARKQSGSFYTPREIVQYMVDESLVAHLKHTVGDELEDEYRKLINLTDEPVALTDQQRSDIFKSLKACKILDPACGSGAFPMGILNRMLAIIERLPIPANISIYDLKLYLIENCIYGIDIQSIAVQISKLRFFISLICEQMPNGDSADNYGIKPLPNLETKFVAANTLIGLTPKKAQLNLFEDPQIEVTRNELMQVRHKHFLASTSKQKKECRDEDKKLREKLAHLLDDNGNFAPEDARQLADWNPYDQNTSSPFFDPGWMFGLKDGVDIVIGNPPYINIKQQGIKIKQYIRQRYDLSQGCDMYVAFIEKGIKLASKYGILTYIVPNKFFGADYGKRLRIHIQKEDITFSYIWDLKDEKVFENAMISTVVIGLSKSSSCKTTQLLQNGTITCKANLFDDSGKIQIEANDEDNSIILKMNKFKPLKIYADIRTGVMGFEYWKMEPIIHNDIILANTVRIYTNGNMSRYSDKWATNEIKLYKDTYFRPVVELNPGYLNNNTIKLFLKKPKILIRGVAKEVAAIIDYEGSGLLVAVHSIIPNNDIDIRYLMGIINSKLINWYHLNTIYSIRIPQGSLKYPISFFNTLPIVIINYQQAIIDLVDQILAAKQANSKADTTVLESEIDQLVYELYGLTEEEIKIVEDR